MNVLSIRLLGTISLRYRSSLLQYNNASLGAVLSPKCFSEMTLRLQIQIIQYNLFDSVVINIEHVICRKLLIEKFTKVNLNINVFFPVLSVR